MLYRAYRNLLHIDADYMLIFCWLQASVVEILMTTPWLSVLIPTYNGALYLSQTLDSLLQDGAQGIECIVIDDGSTDETIEIIRRYEDRLYLRLLQPPHSGNWAENTNLALMQALAEHVCFLHQDDYWLPGRAIAIRNMISDNPSCVLYLNASLFVDERSRPLGKWSCPLPPRPQAINSRLLLQRLVIQDFIAICAPVFKRKHAIAAGGLDNTLWYTADWDFWLKLAATGTALYDARPLTAFRVHNDSQTVRRSTQSDGFRYQLECVLDQHLARHPWLLDSVVKAARMSVEVNVALARLYHGGSANIPRLLMQLFRLGPRGCWLYFRDSQIHQRVLSRLRAGIGR